MTKRPLVPLVGAYLGGIYLAPYVKLEPSFALVMGGVLLPLALLLGVGLKSRLWPLLGAMTAFCLGHFYAGHSLRSLRPPVLTRRIVEVEGWVNFPPRLSERGLSFVLRPLWYRARKEKERERWRWGEISVFVPLEILPEKVSSEVYPGRLVVVEGSLGPVIGASNPGVFDMERYMAGREIGATLRATHLSLGPVGRDFPSKVAWLPHLVRERAEAVLRSAKVGPGDLTSGVLMGMAFGRAVSPVPAQVEEDFRRAGVAHVLVVSGVHVTALSFFVLALCKGYLLGLWRALLPIMAAFFYIALAGFSPSAVRAWLMGSVLFLSSALKRDFDLLSALSLAALVSTLAGPFVAYSPSFQLSYLAALGIAILFGPLDRLLLGLPSLLRKPLAISLSAQLGIWPLFAKMFGQVPLLAPLSNLLVVPLCGILLPALLLSAFLSSLPLLWLLGGALSLATNFITLFLLKIVHFFASLPFSQLEVVGASGPVVGLSYALLFALPLIKADLPKKKARPERVYLWALWGMALLLTLGVATTFRRPVLEVAFLDVGQGEAIFIKSPSGGTMLVDGGHRYVREGVEVDWGRRAVFPFLAAKGVRRLDVVVATHPSDDHVGGLTTALEEFPVRMLFVSDASSTEGTHGQLLELAERKGVRVVEATRGQKLDLGGGVVAFVLWPPRIRLRGTGADDNNNSIVLRLQYGKASFILSADIEEEAERLLSSWPEELRADVLKVAHHGSSTSSTLQFLRAVSPKVAVISVGPANPYGFPSPLVLRRLKAVGARIYRTDLDGAVLMATDGRTLQIRTARPRRRYGG